jgi:hypothetical protein
VLKTHFAIGASFLALAVSVPVDSQAIRPGQGQGSAVATPLTAATADTLTGKQLVFTPWQFGATRGDCSTDNIAALRSAASAAATGGGRLDTSGSCLGIGSTFNPPAGLVWRGDYSEANRIFWRGSQATNPIEVTGAIDLDGIILDGQRPAADVRSGTTVTKSVIAIGFHGSMVADAATYLTGVKIGRLKYENGEASAGIGFSNVSGLTADEINVENNWGAGVFLSGIKSSRIKSISTNDIGNFGTQAARAGQSVSIFAESDPGKAPASWYTIASTAGTLATAQPCRNVLPTDDLWIGSIKKRFDTDTGVYVHDYGPDDTQSPGGRPASCNSATAGGFGTGVGNIRIDNIDSDYGGKDGLKVRRWAGPLSVGTARFRHNGNRFFSVEVWSHDVSAGYVDGDTVGYDVASVLKGDTYGSDLYDGDTSSGHNGLNQTLFTAAYGVSVIQNSYRVNIAGGYIRNVPGLAYSPTSQGYCAISSQSQDVSMTLNCDTTGGQAVRIDNTTRFALDVSAKDACRNQAAGGGCTSILVTPDNGESVNGTIRWRAWDSAAASLISAPVRIAGSPSNINLIGNGNPADFTRANFNSDMVIVSATATNVQSNPIWQISQSVSNATTDANGRISLAISAHAAPMFDNSYVLGSTTYRLLPYSASPTLMMWQVVDAAGNPAPASTNIGTVQLSGHVQNASGY